jgi:hypothetical protein
LHKTSRVSRSRSAGSNVIALAGIALLGGALDPGCAKSLGPSAGDVRLALVLPQGSAVDTVSYLVLSSSGATMAGPGTLDVSDPGATLTLHVVVPATPAGDPGDTVKLSATTSTGVACSGTSAAFPVLAGVTVEVGVTFTCGTATEPTPTSSVGITATIVEGDHCPSITSGVASPATTSVGGTIGLVVTASDADPGETLSYAWAPAASFTNPAASATLFKCVSAGTQSLTVTVSDNHTPPCSTTASLTVTCSPVDANGGLCGDGVVGPLEQCDPPNGVTCSSTCQVIPVPPCGDGIIEPGEECDPPDGNTCDLTCHKIFVELSACTNCQFDGALTGACFNTSAPGQGTSLATFGCDSFASQADRNKCNALLFCLGGAACQAAIHSATPDYSEAALAFDNPLPCLCGNVPHDTCLEMASGWTGVCASEYLAGAANPAVGFASGTVGVANALFECDIDNPCVSACGIGL